MHERAAAALGASCHYQLVEIAGAGFAELRVLLEGVRRLGFAGVNITFPYKELVTGLLDELSPGAAAMGAVNTVVVSDHRLIGHNTDATGFARAASELVAGSGGRSVAVIGAGGVGKAIAFALAELGVGEIRLFDVDRAKAATLASSLKGHRGVTVVTQPRQPSAGSALARWAVGRRRRLYAALDTAAAGSTVSRRAGDDRARARNLSGRRRL